MNRKKKELFKELLTTLLSSNLSISAYEQLYLKIIKYLKNNEEENMIVSNDFRTNIEKAEALLI